MNHFSNDLLSRYKRRTRIASLSASLALGIVTPLAAQDNPKPSTSPPVKTPTTPAPPAKPTTPPPADGTTATPRRQRGQGRGQGRGQNGGAGTNGTNGTNGTGTRAAQTPGTGSPTNAAPPLTTAAAGTTFTFDYRGADIMNVLRFYAQMSGLNVTVDPGLSGTVTIINPKPVSLDEAFKILQSVLVVRGFTAIRDGTVLSVVPLDRGVRSTPLVSNGLNDKGEPQTNPQNQIMTQVIPLENVDAEALAKELDPLKSTGASLIGSPGTNALIITDTASNIERFIKMVDALDKTSNNTELKVYPLKRAEATAIADIINNLYKQITTRGRGAGAQPGQPQQPQQPGQQAPSNGRPAVVAVADARTNSVIVVASPDNQEQVARTIIARLDDDDSNTLDTKIRKIKYANAQDVANLVNTVLSNQRAGGSQSNQQASFGQRQFGGFNPFGGQQDQSQATTSTDPFGKVAADPRTNTLLISATPERMRKIDEFIDQLDLEVPVETTTFVIPLSNAQAQDVADALTQALSTNNSNNNPFSFFGGGGNNNTNTNNRRQRVNRLFGSTSGSSTTGNALGRSAPPGPPNAPGEVQNNGGYDGPDGGSAIPQGVTGVMTADGFIATDLNKTSPSTSSDRTRQFFGFGRQQTRGIGSTNGPQYGRGREGSYSNLLQLQNNVFVTPSPGGDSIIVTTTPDNIKALTDIIKQLDVVQRQVMIEVIVAEVTLDQDQKLGSSLSGAFKTLFGKTNTGQARLNLTPGSNSNVFDVNATGAQFSITGADYTALLQALATDNKVKVLSTPSIFTSNNQLATIQIVTSIPYIGGQDQGTISNVVSNNVKFLDVGFNLNVVPVITRDGLVTIDVAQEASDLIRFQTLGTGNASLQVPQTNVRFANTLVTVQDNETIAIGGLIRDSTALNITKVPVLSEIPLIGQFFRAHEKTRSRTELVIFLTPRIVSNAKEAREMTHRIGDHIVKEIPDLRKQEINLDEKNSDRPVMKPKK